MKVLIGVILFFSDPVLAFQCFNYLSYFQQTTENIQYVAVDEGLFAIPGKTLVSVGVSTCSVLILITNQGRRYLAHVSPSKSLQEFLPQLNPNETAKVSLFLGPLAVKNPHLNNTRYKQLNKILKNNSKLELNQEDLNNALILSSSNLDSNLDRWFNIYLTEGNHLIFEYR